MSFETALPNMRNFNPVAFRKEFAELMAKYGVATAECSLKLDRDDSGRGTGTIPYANTVKVNWLGRKKRGMEVLDKGLVELTYTVVEARDVIIGE